MNQLMRDSVEKNKAIAIGMMFALCLSTYLITNHYTMRLRGHFLPLSWLEDTIPFIPASIWIYLSSIPLCAMSAFLLKDLNQLLLLLYSFACYTCIVCLIYLCYPTIYPRFNFPLPAHPDGFTAATLNWLRQVDYPTTCFPSSHVGDSYLAAFVFLREHKGKFIFFFIWASLISLSTLTLKQHYLLDVFAGFLLAIIIFCLLSKLFFQLEIVNKE